RRLVWVDRRMLDDGFFGWTRQRRLVTREPRKKKLPAIQEDVQVAVRRGLDARDAGDRLQRRGELLRDDARRLLQQPRELEGDRDGEVAHRPIWWNFDKEGWRIVDAKVTADRAGDRVMKVAL